MGMIDSLGRYFSTRGDIAAVYRLPDAYRRRVIGPASLDIGILFHPLVDRSRYEDLRIEIAAGLAVEMNRTDLRIVTLNDISANLGYDLIRRGGPIYCGSEERLQEFESRMQTDYHRSVHDGRTAGDDTEPVKI